MLSTGMVKQSGCHPISKLQRLLIHMAVNESAISQEVSITGTSCIPAPIHKRLLMSYSQLFGV